MGMHMAPVKNRRVFLGNQGGNIQRIWIRGGCQEKQCVRIHFLCHMGMKKKRGRRGWKFVDKLAFRPVTEAPMLGTLFSGNGQGRSTGKRRRGAVRARSFCEGGGGGGRCINFGDFTVYVGRTGGGGVGRSGRRGPIPIRRRRIVPNCCLITIASASSVLLATDGFGFF